MDFMRKFGGFRALENHPRVRNTDFFSRLSADKQPGSSRFIKPGKSVWIGGLGAGISSEDLWQLVRPVGAMWAEVYQGKSKRNGIACFATAQEANAAIAKLNGQPLRGSLIQADVWRRKPKRRKPKRRERRLFHRGSLIQADV